MYQAGRKAYAFKERTGGQLSGNALHLQNEAGTALSYCLVLRVRGRELQCEDEMQVQVARYTVGYFRR